MFDDLAALLGTPSTDAATDADRTPEILRLGAGVVALQSHEQRREALLEALLERVAGERAFLVARVSEETEEESWQVLAARNFEGEQILNPVEKLIHPLLAPCHDRGEGFFTADLEQEPIFEQLCRARQPRSRSLLILPFPSPDRMVYIDHRFQSLDLSPGGGAEVACLFLMLVHTETEALRGDEAEQLERELGEARRALKRRRKTAASAEEDAVPATVRKAPVDSRGLRGDFTSIIGQSPEIVEILKLLDRVAPTNAGVLISGESGTGKELIARAIHVNSPRREASIVSENCGALTETLLESELFGYVKGAFTGAYEDREGLFEVADGGTLFLDEIGDTSPGLQKKLLRVVQEGQIRRVGGNELISVDVRILSATNKDLMAEVRNGRFREDLFYRLNVINVILPALRERIEDLPLLVEHFIRSLNEETGERKTPNAELLSAMSQHTWPGNIRELQNEVRRVYTLSEERLEPAMLSPRVAQGGESDPGDTVISLDHVLELGSLKEATEELERQVLAASLRRFHGNKAQVCARLKMPKTTLYSKLKKYGME